MPDRKESGGTVAEVEKKWLKAQSSFRERGGENEMMRAKYNEREGD